MTAPTLQQISSSQASPEVPINENANATAPAGAFGRKATTTTGPTWGYHGGETLLDGLPPHLAHATGPPTRRAPKCLPLWPNAGALACAW